MHTSHGLEVSLRVPVRVVENGGVGGLQVDAETTGSSAHQKEEVRRVRRVKGRDVHGPLHAVGAAVEPRVLVASSAHEIFEDVEAARELAEQNDAVAILLELGEEPVEDLQLAGRLDERLDGG